MDTNEQLITVNCLCMFFWNYTSAEIQKLREQNNNFSYVWKTYVDQRNKEEYPTTYALLWDLWHGKFNLPTKRMLIDYAIERYGKEVRGQVALSDQMARIGEQLAQDLGQ